MYTVVTLKKTIKLEYYNMKFGVSISSYSSPWEDIRDTIISMDAGRWTSVWCPEHFIPPAAWKGAEDQPMFEAWTLMAAGAGMTNKIRLGHMVSVNTYRNPALVAKMAPTIDQVSQGRFTLSVGAAWFQRTPAKASARAALRRGHRPGAPPRRKRGRVWGGGGSFFF